MQCIEYFCKPSPHIFFNRLVGKRGTGTEKGRSIRSMSKFRSKSRRREVKKPFWHIAVYLKIKFTPNLRRQLAAFSFPQKFSLWQLHELDYIAGSRYVYRDSSHVFGLRQATLHSFLSSYVNFGSS